MNRIFLFIILLLSLSIFISADAALPRFSIADIISPGEKGVLLKGGIITYARIEGKGEVFAGVVKASLPDKAGSLYDYPSGYSIAAVEKFFFKADAALGESMFNRLLDYSSLKGMEYYSLSEGRVIPLILDSRASGGSSIKEEIGGKSAVSFFTIKDNRLGVIPFSSKVCSGNGVLSVTGICSGTVTRFGMKVFEPGDYRVYKYLAYDKTAGGWFYCSVQLMRVRSDILKRFDLLKPENICNRLRGETVHILKLIGIRRTVDMAAFR